MRPSARRSAACKSASDAVQLLFDGGVARHCRQGGQQVLEVADEGDVVEVGPVGETALDHRAQQRGERLPVAFLVDDDDRLRDRGLPVAVP